MDYGDGNFSMSAEYSWNSTTNNNDSTLSIVATANKTVNTFTRANLKLNYYPDFSQIPIVRVVFICLFLIECFVGCVGNLMVCLTVFRNKAMHSPVNYYIVNLGICDFLVGAFVLPAKLFELTAESNINLLGNTGCTILRFLETVVVFASVFTLVSICAERYYAVVYPVLSRVNLKDLRIRRILILVWILPIIFAAPNVWYPSVANSDYLFSHLGEFSRLTCHDTFSAEFRTKYFIFLFVTMYLIPLLFIAVTCISITRVLMRKIPAQTRRDPRAVSMEKGRRKVAKMVLVIVLAFTVCWTPYFIVSLITQYNNFFENGQFFFTMLSINLLCFTNSTINPFIYFAMSARFRKGFIMIVSSLRNCSGRSRFSSSSSVSSARHTSRLTSNGQHPSTQDNLRANNSHRHRSVVVNDGIEVLNSVSGLPFRSSSSSGTIKEYLAARKKQKWRRPRNRTILLHFHHSSNRPCCSRLKRSEAFCRDLDSHTINQHINWQETSRL